MARRRARTVGLSESDLKELIARNDGNCHHCQEDITPANCIVEEGPGAQRIRALLKYYRLEKAKSEGIPAYTVFTDKALESLIKILPVEIDKLQFVYGIADAKTAKYGKDIIAIIRENAADDCALRPICENCDQSEKKAIRIPKGQIDAIEKMGMSFTEFVRMAISKALSSPLDRAEPTTMASQVPPNPESRGDELIQGETYHIARDSDGKRASESFRM
jgi:hypothetical protein